MEGLLHFPLFGEKVNSVGILETPYNCWQGNVTMTRYFWRDFRVNFRDTTSQYNVLIVDDDPAILNLLTHLLEMGHHRVRSASDGNQALQMILQDCPDILISDWTIPGMDGLELCRSVRQLHQRKVLPHYSFILILTALSSKHTAVEALEAGADDFIEKDISSLSDFRMRIRARLSVAMRIRTLEIDVESAAKYDSLTRLLNRVSFFKTAQVLWDRSIRSKTPLAIVMMDCDLFKRVNDIHGHMAGDAVLRELAGILRSFSRTSDIICRYGGEEFCVMLPGCNEEIAWDWADRIRRQCEAIPIKYAGVDIYTTVSFGIAERTESTALVDHLVDRADQALLAAKEWGRNRSVRFTEIVSDSLINRDHSTKPLFDHVTAGDLMIPFPLSIQPHDSAAKVAHCFLETGFETLPVTDHEGKLAGVVSEADLLAMIGRTEQWMSPIKDLVFPNAASYPANTPIRKIAEFLVRTSFNRVLIVKDEVLVGYICHTTLFRWLRSRWAIISGRHNDIIPNDFSSDVLISSLLTAADALKEEIVHLDSVAIVGNDINLTIRDREKMIAAVTQCRDAMDQVLKCGLLSTAGSTTPPPE